MNGIDVLAYHQSIRSRNDELSEAKNELKKMIEESIFLEVEVIDLMKQFPAVDALFFKRIENAIERLKEDILYAKIERNQREGYVVSLQILEDVYNDIVCLKDRREEIVEKSLKGLLGGN